MRDEEHGSHESQGDDQRGCQTRVQLSPRWINEASAKIPREERRAQRWARLGSVANLQSEGRWREPCGSRNHELPLSDRKQTPCTTSGMAEMCQLQTVLRWQARLE